MGVNPLFSFKVELERWHSRNESASDERHMVAAPSSVNGSTRVFPPIGKIRWLSRRGVNSDAATLAHIIRSTAPSVQGAVMLRNGRGELSAVQGVIMNPNRLNSVSMLVLAAALAFAAGAAPAREVSVNHPRHDTKSRASVETCSSEVREESSSSGSSASASSNSSGSEAIEAKSENPNPPGDDRPPE